MFFFIINNFKNLFFLLYNSIKYIKNALYCTFIIGLLLGPGKIIFSFLACSLGAHWLILLFAILLIVINILLRSGLENKSAVISLKGICIPLSIILFLWLMHHFNFLGGEPALYASCLTVLPDWDEIASKMVNFSFPYVNSGQMAVAGKAGSLEVELKKNMSKLIPTSLLMEGEESGSRKRANPDTDSGIAGPSKKVKVTISPSPLDNSNVPTKLYSLAGKSIIDWYPEAKDYKGPEGFTLRKDENGFEYIPCPRQPGLHCIGSSGSISYKPDRAIDKATILDPEDIFSKGWCTDGSRSNQPTASRAADVLLTARVNKQVTISNSMFDTPKIKEFVMAAGGGKSDVLTYRLIIALRISK